MRNNIDISAGKILIAEPFMTEEPFKRTVIGLCDHSKKEGTVGFILNKPLAISLNELIPGVNSDIDYRIGYGGPVGNDTLHYIHNIGDLLDESEPVTRGVYWSGNYEKLKALINSGLVGPDNIRFYIGYSGWSPGQLENELIEHKSWVVSDLDANYVFKTKASEMWQEALGHKGDTFSVLAQIPKSQNFN